MRFGRRTIVQWSHPIINTVIIKHKSDPMGSSHISHQLTWDSIRQELDTYISHQVEGSPSQTQLMLFPSSCVVHIAQQIGTARWSEKKNQTQGRTYFVIKKQYNKAKHKSNQSSWVSAKLKLNMCSRPAERLFALFLFCVTILSYHTVGIYCDP